MPDLGYKIDLECNYNKLRSADNIYYRINYDEATKVGNWINEPQFNGMWTTIKHDYVVFMFLGNRFNLYGYKAIKHGKINIEIDGEYEATVDTFSELRFIGVLLYSSMALALGEHTVKVINADDGKAIGINYLEFGYWLFGSFRFAENRIEASGDVASITIIADAFFNDTISVDVETSDGTAIASVHYQPIKQILTFSSGEMSKTIDIRIIRRDERNNLSLSCIITPINDVTIINGTDKAEVIILPTIKATSSVKTKEFQKSNENNFDDANVGTKDKDKDKSKEGSNAGLIVSIVFNVLLLLIIIALIIAFIIITKERKHRIDSDSSDFQPMSQALNTLDNDSCSENEEARMLHDSDEISADIRSSVIIEDKQVEANSISEDICFNQTTPENDAIIECETRDLGQECQINSNIDILASNQPSDHIDQEKFGVPNMTEEKESTIEMNSNNQQVEPHEQAYSDMSPIAPVISPTPKRRRKKKIVPKQTEEKLVDFEPLESKTDFEQETAEEATPKRRRRKKVVSTDIESKE